MRGGFCSWRRDSAVCRWSATMPRASRKPSQAMAALPRNRCSAPFSASWAWRSCRSRPMWPTLSPLLCAIIMSSNCRPMSQKCKRRRSNMITKITGVLNRVLDEEVRLQVGALEYQVLVPEFIRRRVQSSLGQELTLHTSHYFDGNPMQGRVVPRLIGFTSEAELDFFELFCTVDKVGTRKALKALVRPIKEIADAIQRQDSKWLTTLPGVGAATAEQIIATLRRKVTKYALMTPATEDRRDAGSIGKSDRRDAGAAAAVIVDGNIMEDAYQALLSVGHSPQEARQRLDKALASGQSFQSVEEVLLEIYKGE